MAAMSKEELLSYLQKLGITIRLHEHPVVMTVEEQSKHLGHLGGTVSKNLLLKDKKGRFYLVSALATTNVDLKVLSQRLGLGKSGLRMAPEDALEELLKVPLGSVTPLALINQSARCVVLLLDCQYKTQSKLFFHPLVNDSTLEMTSVELDLFLKSINRGPPYADLEAVVPVGKDHPPDLAVYVPDSTSKPAATEQSTAAVDNSNPIQPKAASPVLSQGKKPKAAAGEKPPSDEGGSLRKLVADPQGLLKHIIDETIMTTLAKVNAKVGDQICKDLAPSISSEVRDHITQDLESLIMLFKNTAYTQGFTAGKAR